MTIQRHRNFRCAAAFAYVGARDTGRFLMQRKSNQEWGLFGGKVENLEELGFIDGIKKQLAEEIGLHFDERRITAICDITHGSHQIIRFFYYQVDREFCPKLNCESLGALWVDITNYPTPINDLYVRPIASLGKFLRSNGHSLSVDPVLYPQPTN